MSEMKRYTLRVNAELLEKYTYIAKYEGRTTNRQLEILMKYYVSKFEARHGEIDITKSSDD